MATEEFVIFSSFPSLVITFDIIRVDLENDCPWSCDYCGNLMQDIVLLFCDFIAQGGDPKKAENTLGARSSLSSFLRPPARPLHHPCENLLVQFPPGKMINVTTTPTAAEGETPPVRSGRKAKTPFVLYFSPLLRHPNRILLGRNSTPRLSTLSVSLSWGPSPRARKATAQFSAAVNPPTSGPFSFSLSLTLSLSSRKEK